MNNNYQAYITRNKSRIKKYDDKLFLNDKENFEIELFNPDQYKVLVKIKLNGNYISTAGLILNPGERVFLDRFIDTNNKFVFESYQVDNTSESKNAIQLNGNVEIQFYAETRPFINFTGNVFNPNYQYNQHLDITPVNYPYSTTDIKFNSLSGSLRSGITFSTAGFTNSDLKLSQSDNKIETGRIEMGEQSDQTFISGHGTFNQFTSTIISYKLLPSSQKPLVSADLRNYCTCCGTRIKKTSWKFCPTCGTEIK